MVYNPSSPSDEVIQSEVRGAGCRRLLDTNVWNNQKHESDRHKRWSTSPVFFVVFVNGL